MKNLVKYTVVIALAIALLYGYNTFIPKNLTTFIIGLPVYVGIILWIANLFETKQVMT
ncbi:hypothetical protein [Exiguobacterium aurantiacum]|uniref:Uncharacterized protein n=1 Tax=Exiguobacterium aurantiacum TaxID=33987 RepID=A0ABY5FQM6_9BACL|nr:hypothetical protein [Exiguobacterium aurantiacum]UTT43733.1 hypothetical protein NMQ00_04295 [Exiguobacterium aurantiacum]